MAGFTLRSGAWWAAALRRHDGFVCPGVGSAHGVEFVSVLIVIEAWHLASLACVILFDVISVDEAIVLILEDAVRYLLVGVYLQSWASR